jgi:hypothetical protein
VQLATLTYDELVQERVVFGTLQSVVDRLHAVQQAVGVTGLIIEPNIGGGLPPECVARSLALCAREVAPQLREVA